MNIFVTKLSPNVTQEELHSLFAQFGTVTSAKIIIDRETGNSKGYGFVEMEDETEGQTAIDALNDTEVDGRRVVIKKARPREEMGGGGGGGRRPSFGGGGGGGFNRERSGGFDRDRGGDRRGGGGWGNGWRDGGGFFNSRPWGNGGFLNSPGWRNGGFLNRF